MITEPAPVKRRKLSDEVHDRLLALIRSNGLKPGDPLPSERELMSAYQVGRPAIREAMQNLQWMGLVEIRHGERPKVAQPSMEAMVEQMAQSMTHLLTHSATTMEHMKDARVAFESAMARRAAEIRTEDDLERLRSALKKQKAMRSDPEAFLRQDGEFHRVIASISRNPIFESLAFAMFNWLANFHVDFVRKLGLEKLTLEEHSMILREIERGHADRAAQTMSDHLTRANKLYHQEHLND